MARQFQERVNLCYKEPFYHPIACHICKRLNDGNTILCSCGMVSFCKQHLKEDGGHRIICDVIKKYKKLVQKKRIWGFQDTTFDKWHDYKIKRLYIIQQRMAAADMKMGQYEEEMIIFSRACYVCYKETDLQPCPKCFSVDYCKTHRESNVPHKCEQLRKWLHIEIQARDLHPVPQYRRAFYDFPNNPVVHDMRSFYEAYILPDTKDQWNTIDIVYSDYISDPLTVYYGMRGAKISIIPKKQTVFVLHIIEAKMHIDRETLLSWEILLHTLAKYISLRIVIVGPHLTSELNKMEGQVETCQEICKSLNRRIYFEYYRMPYHKYVKREFYVEPDLVVGFHVKLKFTEMSRFSRFMEILRCQLCPMILTTESKRNARSIVKKIKKENRNVEPVINEINKFKACRPYRQDARNSIYYRNQYLIVYKDLCSASPAPIVSKISSARKK